MFRCVNLLERPTAGTVRVDGQELTHLSRRELRVGRQYAANIYQHQYWLKEVLAKTHWPLTAVHPVFQWAYSMYSEKYRSINALPKGATIALLNDPANTAQALWLLERAGISQKYKIYAPPAPRAFAGQLVVGTKYLHDPQIVKLIKVFLDPRVQPYLRTTTNPQLKDQLTPVSTS